MKASFDPKILAAEFAEAVQGGREPAIAPIDAKGHLFVLRRLIQDHSLAACRRYAVADDIPWGRFSKLDDLRMLVLQAPRAIDPGMADGPVFAPGTDVAICPRAGATRTMLVFTGVAHQFGGPLRLIHRWLASRNLSLIYLADTDWNYYLGPMNGLGVSLADKIEALRAIMGDMGSTSCCCLGNSGGGFGALLFAAGLGARRALAYSPPTKIRESLAAILQRVPNLDPLLAPDGTIDLADLLTRAETATKARIYFPAGNPHDSDEARNLASVPWVDAIPIEGLDGHNLVPRMVDRGLFAAHLDWLAGD